MPSLVALRALMALTRLAKIEPAAHLAVIEYLVADLHAALAISLGGRLCRLLHGRGHGRRRLYLVLAGEPPPKAVAVSLHIGKASLELLHDIVVVRFRDQAKHD
jgi:hypothetical protein